MIDMISNSCLDSGKDAQKLLYAEAIFVCRSKQIILFKISLSIQLGLFNGKIEVNTDLSFNTETQISSH